MLHPLSPYRVLRCFSPLPRRFLWLSDLSDLSRVPHGFTPDLCGFGAGSNRFVTASRVHQLGAFLVVRSLFVGVFLGSSPGVHGASIRGAGVGFWAVYHARGRMRPNKPV